MILLNKLSTVLKKYLRQEAGRGAEQTQEVGGRQHGAGREQHNSCRDSLSRTRSQRGPGSLLQF